MAVNTVIDVEMNDGSMLKMTLNFGKIFLLRNKDKKTYDEYMRITGAGAKNEMDLATILYAAYLCANIDKKCMSFLDFLEILPVNREEVQQIYWRLQPKKKQDSLQHSGKKQKVRKEK